MKPTAEQEIVDERAPLPDDLPKTHHETRDTDVSRLAAVGAGVVVIMLLSLVLMAGLDRHWRRQPDPLPAPSVFPWQRQAPPAEADVALHSFGWTDRAAGKLHIPIEDAMLLVAAKGASHGQLPALPAATVEPSGLGPGPLPGGGLPAETGGANSAGPAGDR